MMTPEEREVIEAAKQAELYASTYEGHQRLIEALNALVAGEVGPNWILRTWADVRRGDTVRMPGTEHTAKIKDRYIPPAASRKEAMAGPDSWHIIPGQGHWNDHVVRPSECWLVFEGESELRNMDPAKPVEILLSTLEVQAIEAIGWENRMEMRDAS